MSERNPIAAEIAAIEWRLMAHERQILAELRDELREKLGIGEIDSWHRLLGSFGTWIIVGGDDRSAALLAARQHWTDIQREQEAEELAAAHAALDSAGETANHDVAAPESEPLPPEPPPGARPSEERRWLNRLAEFYRRKGYSDADIRRELTDALSRRRATGMRDADQKNSVRHAIAQRARDVVASLNKPKE